MVLSVYLWNGQEVASVLNLFKMKTWRNKSRLLVISAIAESRAIVSLTMCQVSNLSISLNQGVVPA